MKATLYFDKVKHYIHVMNQVEGCHYVDVLEGGWHKDAINVPLPYLVLTVNGYLYRIIKQVDKPSDIMLHLKKERRKLRRSKLDHTLPQ